MFFSTIHTQVILQVHHSHRCWKHSSIGSDSVDCTVGDTGEEVTLAILVHCALYVCVCVCVCVCLCVCVCAFMYTLHTHVVVLQLTAGMMVLLQISSEERAKPDVSV